MADSLRDLVVSLSLNTDNFTRNIKSVNKQIQEAESFFKLAAAGVENFDTSAAGLAARLTTLQRELSLQSNVVEQYQRALTAANAKLQETYARQQDYGSRLTAARQRQAELGEEVRRAQSAFDGYKTSLGETNSVTIAAGQNLEAAKAEYSVATAEVTKLAGQHDALKRSTQNAADAVSTIQSQLNKAQAAYRTTETDIESVNQKLALAQTSWASAGEAIESANSRMSTVGKLGGLVESQYRLAGAGVKDFENTQAGLQARITELTDKVNLQRQTVNECSAVLAAAKDRVQAAQDAADPEKVQEATDAVIEAQTALNNAKATLRELEIELRTASSAWTSLGDGLIAGSENLERIAQKAERAGRVMTMTMTTPIVALGTKAVNAAMEFESSFTSVRKTVDATEEQFASLAQASKEMSTQIAADTSTINEVMATGGQLGIATENLTDFTRVMIDLGNSTEDLSAQEAAATIAKFANIMGTDQTLFRNIGSTLVELGNNFATTEQPIMTMAQRLAGAGKQVGLTEAEILGFAAGFSAVGIEAQMGGSAFSKALIKMEVAAETGSDALKDFADVASMSTDEFKALWDTNPADAFMAFISGLSQMDEEGISAIKTLNDMGIAEIRLRDTLLRATNATEMFESAQKMAEQAWEENNALAEEANKRYATQASQLTNLKNKAVLFGQELGDTMMPAISNIMDGLGSFIERLQQLDTAQKESIIKWGLGLAAAGPALTVFGKTGKAIASVGKSLGSFAKKVGEAGGGMKGLGTVLGSSTALWAALSAGVLYGTVKLGEYVTGVKAARDAMNEAADAADNWKNHTAETFYTSGEGLSRFGMNSDDFIRGEMTAAQWIANITDEWKDNIVESDETVDSYVASFKKMTAATRDSLAGMKQTASEAGYKTIYDGIVADMQALNLIDAQIEELLKKRKEFNLSDEDMTELERLLGVKADIEIKYHLTEADAAGFDELALQLENIEARAAAAGLKVADSVYEDALIAAAEGMSNINSTLDKEYDARMALIRTQEHEGMTDAEKAAIQAQKDDLDAWYREQRMLAGREYAEAMAKPLSNVMQSRDFKKTFDDVTELYNRLAIYRAESTDENRNALLNFTAGLDEDTLVTYYTTLTQINSLLDQGLGYDEISKLTGVDAGFLETALTQLGTIKDYLDTMDADGSVESLRAIFADLGDEVLKIATDLDLEGAEARWAEFAANPGADVFTNAVVESYTEGTGVTKDEITPLVTAVVSGYQKGKNAEGGEVDTKGVTPVVDAIIKEYAYGADRPDTAEIAPFVTAFVEKYASAENKEGGLDLSDITPMVTAVVTAYEKAAGENAPSADSVSPEVAAFILDYKLKNGKLPSTEEVDAYVTAFVETYEEDPNKKPLTGKVSPHVTAYVDSYTPPEGITLEVPASPKPLEDAAVTNWNNANRNRLKLDADVTPKTVEAAFGSDYFAELKRLYEAGKAEFYGADGLPLDVTPAVLEQLDGSDILIGIDADGVYHVSVRPEWDGAGLEEAKEAADDLDTGTAQNRLADVFGFSQQKNLELALNSFQAWENRVAQWESRSGFGKWLLGNTPIPGNYISEMEDLFDPEAEKEMAEGLLTMASALNNGAALDEGTLETYSQLVTLAEKLAGFGSLGYAANSTFLNTLAQGAELMGYNGKQTGLADWLRGLMGGESLDYDAIDAAAEYMDQMQSIADKYGEYAKTYAMYESPGAWVGMNELADQFSELSGNGGLKEAVDEITAISAAGGTLSVDQVNLLAAYAQTLQALGQDVPEEVSSALEGVDLSSVGFNIMAGITEGVNSGKAGFVNAIIAAINEGKAAAQATADINSPSRVFRDEVGLMMMRGIGEGIKKGTEEQAKIMSSATRYLTSEAAASAVLPAMGGGYSSTTNNYSDSVNINGNTFEIRSEQDIRDLAQEIAALTKRQQAGKGARYL